MDIDPRYMRRALQLAECGRSGASPNPMVGAVIVTTDGRIAGEGYHRLCGSGHAEVNAVADLRSRHGSEADRIMRNCTMYVTLEPCAHYGKTPPCAKLIIDSGIPRVVAGTVDPFSKVSGRGIAMLREAGVEVVTGLMQHECRELNRRFFTAHTLRRPWVTLKWAQSADGFMDARRNESDSPVKFSSTTGSTLVHRLRSLHDGIAAGSGTFIADRPRMDCRLWPGGRPPRRIAIDRRHRIDTGSADIIADGSSWRDTLDRLYATGITSVLVEGGSILLNAITESGIWDEARIETAPVHLGNSGMAPAPQVTGIPAKTEWIGQNTVHYYHNNWLDLDSIGVKNL